MSAAAAERGHPRSRNPATKPATAIDFFSRGHSTELPGGHADSPSRYSTVFQSVDHERLYDEFIRLCELPASARDTALCELRATNPELADELEGLLAADAVAGTSRGLLTVAVWRAADEALDGNRVGERVGRFILLRRLGQGGMGVVYSAFDVELERTVAVKLIRSARAEERERDRLLREARAMAKLSHPHVVTVYEAGTVGDEVYIAMEHIDGPTLREWVDTQPRSWRAVIAVYDGAAAGLAAAHAAGLVHHDFKPDNVLVDGDGGARVLDFGLARQLGPQTEAPADGCVQDHSSTHATIDDVETTTITRSVVLGTPAYMAPEQVRDRRGDYQSDQFAFCVSLHEALYAARPFRGDTIAELFANVMRGELEPPPPGAQVPGWLREVLLRGLRVDPAERWPSMDALRSALGRGPYRARRRVAVVGGPVALALGIWGLGSIAKDDLPKCRDAAQHLVGVWDSPRRETIARVLPDTSAPAVLAALDSYAQTWLEGHVEACVATHLRGEQSSELLDQRMQCLTRKRRELAVLVDALASADPNVLSQAEARARALSPVADCADPDFLATMTMGAEQRPRAVDTERLREELATARTCLVAYDEPEYRGQSWVFCSNADAPPRAAWERRVSSVRLPKGALARLCTEADGGGRCLELRNDAPWFSRALHVDGQTFEGFDDRISSVEWKLHDDAKFRVPLIDADASDESIASLVRLGEGGFTRAVVFVDIDTVGSADAWRDLIQRLGNGTGLHLWPAWERGIATSCWSTDCAVAAFRHLDHAIASGLPLSYDAEISDTYGALERERVQRGSLSYSWHAGSFRFVQLHQRGDLELAHERWNPDDALRERVELSSALAWLDDELLRASQEQQTAIVLVGEVTASLLSVAARHPDVVILSRTPYPESTTGLPIRSSQVPTEAQFVYLELEPDRATAYAALPGDKQPMLLWYVDLPRGYQRWKDTGIYLHDDRELEGLSAAACAAACDAETAFMCRSFDIDTHGVCHLSAVDSSQVELRWHSEPWSHYERTVARDFELHPDAAIAGHNTRRLPQMTVAGCLAACRAETDFVCKSVDFDRHQKSCDLSDKSIEEVGLQRYYRPFDHYARIDAPTGD
jgi:tRNA A-37 threonylcarbamoyl transferase component Bud32